MRLKENALSNEEAVEILERNSFGTLALAGDSGYPYAVPVNYAYGHDKIYIHGAPEGHKLDAISQDSKVSFCVVEKDDVIPEEFNSLFKSAIVFGRARILTDDTEKRYALEKILQKYSSGFIKEGEAYIDAEWDQVAAVEISIEHLTAKKGT